MSLLVLTAADCNKIISSFEPNDLVTLMEDVFTSYSRSQTHSRIHSNPPSKSVAPPRTKIQTENYTALFMPARLEPYGTSIKVVSVLTDASLARGLSATTLVLDEQTGAVRGVVNATRLTPLRNAAGSLLSSRLVGPKHPTSIVAFGAGMQIESNLDLHLRSYPSIKTCTIINRTKNARLDNLCVFLSATFPGVSIAGIGRGKDNQAEGAVEAAVRSASIVICATSATQALFPSAWVHAGTHVILIGSYTPAMREVDRELIRRACPKEKRTNSATAYRKGAPILLVDSIKACAEEAGELIDAQLSPDDMVEIGEMIATSHAGENVEDDKQVNDSDFAGPITIFKSVGIAAQDVAIASAVFTKAQKLSESVGTKIDQYDSL
ncbi:hypothetical protein HGRIS_010983 [Hohenbuehelia grisea]|uniref:Ketimine reductase mu-crystallin n=1 Tax=Hohenbuehelia grisea TaxID=104357 RepID=A0ABR3IYI3_9AGAR